MYLDPREPQLKEVPTLLIAEGDPTEGEIGENLIKPPLADLTECCQFQRAGQRRKRWQ